jgi:hypothetical protein
VKVEKASGADVKVIYGQRRQLRKGRRPMRACPPACVGAEERNNELKMSVIGIKVKRPENGPKIDPLKTYPTGSSAAVTRCATSPGLCMYMTTLHVKYR